MSHRTIATSLAPDVQIGQVLGSLEIKGWERPEIAVKAEPSELDLEEGEDTVRISCRSDLVLRLPHGATVHVERVHGEARFKLLEDQLTIEQVMGSLVLRNVAETTVESVYGELLAKHVAGDLRVRQVMGNASVRDVQGDCALSEVQGNLDIREVEGNVEARAHGDARLRLSQMDGLQYSLEASGNLSCRIPDDASAQVELHSDGHAIRMKLPQHSATIGEPDTSFTLGSGEAQLTLSAGGELVLSSWEGAGEREDDEEGTGFDGPRERTIPPEFHQKIAEQIEAQMEAMTRHLDEHLSHLSSSLGRTGFPEGATEEILQRARETSERAASRAQERLRRAQEKLERKLEATRRRNEARAHAAARRSQARGRQAWGADWGPVPPVPPIPPVPPQPRPVQDPVSEEERLMILRMLEQKKISIEEAEQLLAALENKGT